MGRPRRFRRRSGSSRCRIYGLVGPDGSGRATVLEVLAGFRGVRVPAESNWARRPTPWPIARMSPSSSPAHRGRNAGSGGLGCWASVARRPTSRGCSTASASPKQPTVVSGTFARHAVPPGACSRADRRAAAPSSPMSQPPPLIQPGGGRSSTSSPAWPIRYGARLQPRPRRRRPGFGDHIGVLAKGSSSIRVRSLDLPALAAPTWRIVVRPPADRLVAALTAAPWIHAVSEGAPGDLRLDVRDPAAAELHLPKVLAEFGVRLVEVSRAGANLQDGFSG